MDDYYDFNSARLQLDTITQERISLEPKVQLATFAQDCGGLSTSVVQNLPDEAIKWRLTSPSDGSDELEEIVLRVQGVLCEKELPPAKIGNRSIGHQAKYMRQSVVLTGFNNDFFAGCLESLSAADERFIRQFETDKTTPWKKETYLDYDAITISNRYFTNVSNRSYLQGVPFTKFEDPTGKLSELGRESGLLHCEENIVKFFRVHNNRVVRASPLIFSSGDVVEALVSLVMVSIDRKHTLKPILRGLTLIDDKETKKAATRRSKEKAIKGAPARFKLKRKVGYSDDDSVEEEGARRGVMKLNLETGVSVGTVA